MSKNLDLLNALITDINLYNSLPTKHRENVFNAKKIFSDF